MTHRGVSGSVTVTSGHEGLDAAGRSVAPLLGAGGGPTLVVLMGVSQLRQIAAGLIAHGADPRTPAALVEQGSTEGQRTTRAGLGDVADTAARAGVRAPAVLVVGAVAAQGLLRPARMDR